MCETQCCNLVPEFTVPGHATGFVRRLFEDRLAIVMTVLDDPLVNKVFTKQDLQKLAFEALELAKMIKRMVEAENA